MGGSAVRPCCRLSDGHRAVDEEKRHHACIGRDRPPDRPRGLPARGARAARGPAQRPVRPAGAKARADPGADQRHRGRRPRRDRQPADVVDGSAARPRQRLRAADPRGARPPAGVPLLAGVAAQGQDRRVHERVVPGPPGRRASGRHRPADDHHRDPPHPPLRPAGASPPRTAAPSSATALRTRCGSTCCASPRPARRPGTSSRAATRATATSPSARSCSRRCSTPRRTTDLPGRRPTPCDRRRR